LTTKASARYQVVPRLAFSVIKILAGTLIDPHELARADRFSDEVYGNDLLWVEISARVNLTMIHLSA